MMRLLRTWLKWWEQLEVKLNQNYNMTIPDKNAFVKELSAQEHQEWNPWDIP